MSSNTKNNNIVQGDFHYFDVITNVLKHHSKGDINVPERDVFDLMDLEQVEQHLVTLELIKPEDSLLHSSCLL